MKKKSIFKKALIALGLFSAVGLQAQTFPEFENATPSGTPMVFRGCPLWGDYNNDGKMEAVVLGRQPGTDWPVHGFILKYTENGLQRVDGLENIGLPAFNGSKDKDIYNAVMAWIDYNNDGLMDLLLMGNLYDENRPGERNPDQSDNDYAVFLDLYKNTGEGFSRVESTGLQGLYIEEESNYASVISVGDYNNDGYMDFIVTGIRNGVRHVDLYKNDKGTGKFVLQEGHFDALSAGSVSFADFNNDGWLDVIVNGWSSEENNAKVMMYLNNQDGTFTDNGLYYFIPNAGRASKGQIGVADINGDGYLDFVVTGEVMLDKDTWSKTTDIYYFESMTNDGLLDYKRVSGDDVFIDAAQRSSVEFLDINGDGLMDIVIAGEVGSSIPRTSIYLQEEDGTFLSEHDLIGSVRSGAIVTFADYDNDGYQDVMVMGYNNLKEREGIHFEIYRNKGNLPKNNLPGMPSNLKTSYENGIMTFTWDAGTDVETPIEALRYNFYLKKSDKEIYMILPADISTGTIRLSNLTTALTTTSYSLSVPDGEYEWGVQTIDQGRGASKFAKLNATGIETLTKDMNVIAYGENGQIYVTVEDAPVKANVYDATGKHIVSASVTETGAIAQLEKGIYLVQLQVGKSVKTYKVIL